MSCTKNATCAVVGQLAAFTALEFGLNEHPELVLGEGTAVTLLPISYLFAWWDAWSTPVKKKTPPISRGYAQPDEQRRRPRSERKTKA